MSFLYNAISTVASYANPLSYFRGDSSSAGPSSTFAAYNTVTNTIGDGSVSPARDDDNSNTSTSSSNKNNTSNNNNNKSRNSSFDDVEFFFAKHFADETLDFRHLARKYHQGLQFSRNHQDDDNNNSNNSCSVNNFPPCKLCVTSPATFFASDLNGIFVTKDQQQQKTHHHQKRSTTTDAASSDSPQVQMCFECFILAFRSLVLPELVKRDPQQTKAILTMIDHVEEASLEDACATPREGDDDNSNNKNSKLSSTRALAAAPRAVEDAANKNKKRLFCVRCRYPCTEDTDTCSACKATTPWSITCEQCKTFASQFPPICVKTGKAHVLWSCESCTVINTLDTPECAICGTVRTWKCPRCEYAQRSRRTEKGERNCSKCGYTYTEMSSTTIRKFGLEEDSVRRTDQANHERQKAAYTLEQRIEKLFSAQSSTNNNNNTKKRTSSASSKRKATTSNINASLKRIEQDGDGNCAFRSISFNLFGTPNGHMLVRKAACHGLYQRKKELEGIFENEDAFRNYIALMEQSGTWADEMALRVSAIIFGVNIHLISSHDTHWYFKFSPVASFAFDAELEEKKRKMTSKQLEQEEKKKLDKDNTRPHIFLAYYVPVHYDSLAICFKSSNPQDSSNNHQSSGSFEAIDEDGATVMNVSTSQNANVIRPVSIPQLISKLTTEFAQEEDQWVDVDS